MKKRNNKSYYSTWEMSDILELNPVTVLRWCKKGRLKDISYSVGNRWRVKKEDFHDFLDKEGLVCPH